MTDAPEWLCLGQDMHGFWSTSAVDMDAARYTRTDLAEAAERAAYLRGMEDAAKVADLHLGMVTGHHPDEPLDDDVAQGYGNAALNIAAAIRALAKEVGE